MLGLRGVAPEFGAGSQPEIFVFPAFDSPIISLIGRAKRADRIDALVSCEWIATETFGLMSSGTE